MALVTGIIAMITGGCKVAEQVLIKSNTKESRKFLQEWDDAKKKAIEAERMVDLEKAKPQKDQFDSIVEHFESKAEYLHKLSKSLSETADKELERMLASKGA